MARSRGRWEDFKRRNVEAPASPFHNTVRNGASESSSSSLVPLSPVSSLHIYPASPIHGHVCSLSPCEALSLNGFTEAWDDKSNRSALSVSGNDEHLGCPLSPLRGWETSPSQERFVSPTSTHDSGHLSHSMMSSEGPTPEFREHNFLARSRFLSPEPAGASLLRFDNTPTRTPVSSRAWARGPAGALGNGIGRDGGQGGMVCVHARVRA